MVCELTRMRLGDGTSRGAIHMTNTTAENPERVDEQFVLDQLRLESLAYNKAVGSFNTHLKHHKTQLNLHELPYRKPVSVPADTEEMGELLQSLLDETYLDSEVRRHPTVAPILVDAVEHLEIARTQLIKSLEDELLYVELVERDIRVA